eukprot:CAMPEP_0197297918 /NCGR_PEP_ID=MMETSP0890-20130614/42302_1 /TAXON_ID=44058 ORGANISM="Aureoumbra lagunensis, Strain CCMP1510" /NCGR_SAMPLE_ID=MMETSP0890 /ASSEMBLY_ACC=CAM_ASM_000533 /LENGTH=340 /DNA_ID=CAMNT_0042775323 /DNA_START=308 /DNA_END=1333 /DNA_ORIENTATION=-
MVVTGEGDVLLEDLEFKNGYTEGSGGALTVLGGATVDIVRCTFTSSHADIGGAIFVSSSNLNVLESIFSSNNARAGSAIYASFGVVKITDSTISNSKAINDGGAIVLKSSHGDISRSTFQANEAVNGGCIAAMQESVLTVDESVFKKNKASLGAAIFISKSTGGLTKSVFENGKADQGGAVAVEGASITTSSCTFRKNTAQLGGAVWFDGGDWVEEFSSIFENVAEMMGGGLFLGNVGFKSTETLLRDNVPEQTYTVSKTISKQSKPPDVPDQSNFVSARRRLTSIEDPIDIVQTSPHMPLFFIGFCSFLSSILIVSKCTSRKRQLKKLGTTQQNKTMVC